MRIGRRLVKALVWGLLLCLSILGGGLWFAYWYMTDGETVAQLIREHAVRYFPRSTLDPGRVRISLYGGELVFRQLRMIQKIDGAPFEVLRIPWLNIKINNRKLAKGHLEAREVVVGTPTLRLRRRRDGTWNLEGLLADPWPGPWIDTPPITIQNATLELFPDEEPIICGVHAARVIVIEDGRRIWRRAGDFRLSHRGRGGGIVTSLLLCGAAGPPAAWPIAARRSSAMSPSRSRVRDPALSTSSSRARRGGTPSRK